MKGYTLNIADYRIRFESGPGGPELEPADRFRSNISVGGTPDVTVRVHPGSYDIPASALRVFHAPYVEELKGVLFSSLENFWSVWKDGDDLFIRTVFPMISTDTGGVLKFSLYSREWDLWLDDTGKAWDPMEYPLDGLILYYMTVISGDIMIHASGVESKGRGFLFAGVSGKGKSTMASLWEKEGATVIHDDRLILRRISEGYVMHNTPVYVYDPPRSAPLDRIYIIDHGSGNIISRSQGAQAAGLVMANCVQHNWGREIIAGLLMSVTRLVSEVAVRKLSFVPDRSVTEKIEEDE